MGSDFQAQLGDDLYAAVTSNDTSKVTTLLASSSSSPPWSMILTSAASADAASVVTFALQHNAPVTDTAMSCILARRALACYRAIIEAKAIDINHFIPWYGDILGNMAAEGNVEFVRFCLQNGADPNKNLLDEYMTVLAVAARKGHSEVVEILLDHGAKLEGSGAIVLAAEDVRTDVVRLLLGKGADVNEMGVKDATDERCDEDVGGGLHKAIMEGHVDTALLLIEKGADTDLRDAQGRTARALAMQAGMDRLLEKMRKT